MLVARRHNLIDAKINLVLSLCHDRAILSAVQSIILNTNNSQVSEESSQQQHTYLQSTTMIVIVAG